MRKVVMFAVVSGFAVSLALTVFLTAAWQTGFQVQELVRTWPILLLVCGPCLGNAVCGVIVQRYQWRRELLMLPAMIPLLPLFLSNSPKGAVLWIPAVVTWFCGGLGLSVAGFLRNPKPQ